MKARLATLCILVWCVACTHAPRPGASIAPSAASSASVTKVSTPYLIVTRQNLTSVRIIPIGSEQGSDLDVGATTLGAQSNGTVAALAAPAAHAVVLVSGWPPVVRTVKGLATPHEVAFTSTGKIAVTEENGNSLALIDPSTATIAKRIDLHARPHDVVPGKGSDLIVTMPNSREILHVDPASGAITHVKLGERPHACVQVSYGIWCVTYDAPHVLLVQGDKVTKHLEIGIFPHHVRAEANGDVLVSDPQAGRVSRIDHDGRVVERFDVPRAEQVLEDRGTIYVASDNDLVEVFAGAKPGVRWSIRGKPHAIAAVG